jgi:CRP/FNR family cyclic AMP-dependent transcriptional regulator
MLLKKETMDRPVKEDVRIDFLSNVSLFSSLSDDELRQISSKVLMQEFSKNETIFREEDTNNYMYVILVGKVKVVRNTEDGKEVILAIHGADDFFGEVALIDNKTTPAAVVATEDSLIAIISKKDFYALVYSQPKVLDTLLQILCSRLRESWERILMLNFRNASERVKMLFVALSFEKGKRMDEGILLDLNLTHQEIADMSGLSRESVTRVLNKWQKDEEIIIGQNKCIILNEKFLRREPVFPRHE